MTDPNLPLLTKVTSLLQVLQARGNYALVEKLRSRLVLTTMWIDLDVAWNLDEVLVSSVEFPQLVRIISGCSLIFCVQCINIVETLSKLLLRPIRRTKPHQLYGLEFEERGLAICVFIRARNGDDSRRVAIGVCDRLESDVTRELSVFGSVLVAVGNSASPIAISGRSHILPETYEEYLGSGYKKRRIDYPTFNLRLFKRCLQKGFSSAFGNRDPFSVTHFFVHCLNGAKHRDWLTSQSILRRTLTKIELQMPSLVLGVANNVGMWPLIVSYLKEIGKNVTHS